MTKVAALWSRARGTWLPVRGPRQHCPATRARFHVAKWRMFYHPKTLQSRPARLKQFCLTEPVPAIRYSFLLV